MLDDVCDVTESLAFRSNDQNSMEDLLNSPQKYYATHYVKCFNCYGVKEKQQNCQFCDSRNYVSMNHPLSLLLDQVINKKLKVQPHIRQSIWADLEKVQTIKQEEEEVDQRKLLCDICRFQCEQCELYCQTCQCFYVCKECSQKTLLHQHPLIKYSPSTDNSPPKNQDFFGPKVAQKFFDIQSEEQQTNKTPWYIIKDGSSFFNDSVSQSASAIITRQVNIQQKINQSKFNALNINNFHTNIEQRQSFQFGQPRQSIGMCGPKLCHNCYKCIQNYFSICLTCKKKQEIYEICDKCFQSKKYDHKKSHEFCSTMYVSLNDDENCLHNFGQSDQEKDQFKDQGVQINVFRLTKKNSSIVKFMQEQASSPTFMNKSVIKSKIKLRSSQTIQNIILNPRQSLQKNNIQQQSRVFVDYSDLYSSSDLNQELKGIHLLHKQSSNYDVNNSLQKPSKLLFKQTFQKDLSEHQLQQFAPIYKYVQSDGQCSAQNLNCQHLEDKKDTYDSKLNGSSFESAQYLKLKQKIKQFYFVDYQCDICHIQPIKNVRFHCTKCQNYDICQKCHSQNRKKHNHTVFQKIDGVKMMIEKQLLQKKDLNKYEKTNLLKSKKQIGIQQRKMTQSVNINSNLLKSTTNIIKRTKII